MYVGRYIYVCMYACINVCMYVSTLDNHQIEYGLIYFPELLQLFFFPPTREPANSICTADRIWSIYQRTKHIYIYV